MITNTITNRQSHPLTSLHGPRHRRSVALGFLSLLLTATLAWAAPSTTVTCFPPNQAGKVTLRLFQWVDGQGTHGFGANVSVDIPAGIRAEQKAALIEAAINRATGGTSIKVVRTGSTLTITDGSQPPARPYGVSCLGATDSTGEIMLVDNDSTGVPVDYVTTVKLTGTPLGGAATFGENGMVSTVPTTNRSLMQIYQGWRARFGEGTVSSNGLQLPLRHGEQRSFYLEVTDPGLTIDIDQAMRGSSELPRLNITPVRLADGRSSVELSWPITQPFSAEPELERTPALAPQTYWLAVEHQRRILDGRNVVTLPAEEAQSFFRLRFSPNEDTTPPALLSATPACGGLSVQLALSEPVDPASVMNPANYSITGLSVGSRPVRVVGAFPLPPNGVQLQTDVPLLMGGSWIATAQQVRDLAGNVMAGTAYVSFGCGPR